MGSSQAGQGIENSVRDKVMSSSQGAEPDHQQEACMHLAVRRAS